MIQGAGYSGDGRAENEQAPVHSPRESYRKKPPPQLGWRFNVGETVFLEARVWGPPAEAGLTVTSPIIQSDRNWGYSCYWRC